MSSLTLDSFKEKRAEAVLSKKSLNAIYGGGCKYTYQKSSGTQFSISNPSWYDRFYCWINYDFVSKECI